MCPQPGPTDIPSLLHPHKSPTILTLFFTSPSLTLTVSFQLYLTQFALIAILVDAEGDSATTSSLCPNKCWDMGMIWRKAAAQLRTDVQTGLSLISEVRAFLIGARV